MARCRTNKPRSLHTNPIAASGRLPAETNMMYASTETPRLSLAGGWRAGPITDSLSITRRASFPSISVGMDSGIWSQSNQPRLDSLDHFLSLEYNPADLICNLWNVRGLTIAENNNCDLVINVTPDFS